MTAAAPGAGRSLGAWTSAEVEECSPVLLVPLGSTEQHGPHLPLDTDTRIAVALCERVAAAPARVGAEATVAVGPAVAYGASGEHQGFAGTLSIGRDALVSVIVELGRSAGDDYRLVVFVNGHGGNAEAVARATAVLAAEGRAVLAWSPSLAQSVVDGPAEGDSHAGRVETSVLLALAPETVRRERAEAGVTDPLSSLMADLRAGGMQAVSANGVLGDPAGASAAEGERLLKAWSASLADALAAALIATAGR